MKKFISKETQEKIASAIQDVERKTDAEIVTVVAQSADSYYYIPTMWAALLALLVPAVEYLFVLEQDILHNYFLQILIFMTGVLFFRIPFIMYRLIPSYVKEQRARSLAYEQFLMQNLHATKERTGVLIFVSVAERYVRVIADKGINDKVDEQVWQNAVDALTKHIKDNDVEGGFLEAVHLCSIPLIEHFPATDTKNELPNRLVIL